MKERTNRCIVPLRVIFYSDPDGQDSPQCCGVKYSFLRQTCGFYLKESEIHLGSQKQNLSFCLKWSALNYTAIITDALLLAE